MINSYAVAEANYINKRLNHYANSIRAHVNIKVKCDRFVDYQLLNCRLLIRTHLQS